MRAPDFYNLIAKERGMPDGWKWNVLKAVGENRERGGVLVVGAVCTATYTRGKRKGWPNWSKRDKSTERELFIAFADYDERVAAWERETGFCSHCDGTGQMTASVSIGGKTFRPCSKCNATGRKPTAETAGAESESTNG